ncbi:glutamate-5-semialdehyde dehydrogenase [Proteiniclasticum sp. SCR006]|uniref:Gamma-glutamyl phosphate reductase n=1 Tax=Proteiniclasticum aestuarii TaxID=2817862 RepID=A0A939HAW5_9CLOT|nr:glutamate-5-semialdehyde dehydrogenase [Proteiniclasticum aestuarii]MBO1264592.1 glutamate-5-semialdehyde dehydrogenase [Proteiniclasticum aestuarii]
MIEHLGRQAKAASRKLARLGTVEKNRILSLLGENLMKRKEEILAANAEDLSRGKENGLSSALMDRLLLNEERIRSMKDGLLTVEKLDDPVGEIREMKTLPNGLKVGKKSVPLGVVGIIYESRPNVTIDTAALCLKSSNALILRGGKEAISSNKVLVEIVQDTLKELGHDPFMVQLIEDLSYETAGEFMRMNAYLDVLIPRGSAKLIQRVVKEATVPVIETGVGNCHVFVDESADFSMALDIIVNAKTQRTGVCNAMESLLVHEAVADAFLPALFKTLKPYGVKVMADEKARQIIPLFLEATEEDYAKEYLDLAMSLKTVKDLREAMDHIEKYGTGHSEAIITKDYDHAMTFTDEVDAAAVYVNASTRFTDGSALGMGAEMGISTQKLHARGPVGLKELTTTKYIIFGNGQVRP